MSMSISQFYILSQRGDTIITRDFRGDVPKGTAEIFFRKATLWRQGEDTPPIFHSAGVNYLFVKKNGLFFVCTSQTNSNATLIIELLNKIAKVFKVDPVFHVELPGVPTGDRTLVHPLILSPKAEVLSHSSDEHLPTTPDCAVPRSFLVQQDLSRHDDPRGQRCEFTSLSSWSIMIHSKLHHESLVAVLKKRRPQKSLPVKSPRRADRGQHPEEFSPLPKTPPRTTAAC